MPLSKAWTLAVVAIVAAILSTLPSPSLAVRPHDFKKCHDSSFCRRLRRLSTYAANTTSFVSPYSLPASGLSFDEKTATLTAPITSALYPEVDFEARFIFHADGTARVQMDEVGPRYNGWKRYDEAAKWAYDRPFAPAEPGSLKLEMAKNDDGKTVVHFGNEGASLEIVHRPFKATFLREGREQIVLNDRGLLHMEHFRAKKAKQEDKNDEASEDDAAAAIDAPSQLVLSRRSNLTSAGHPPHLATAWADFEQTDPGEWEESWAGRQDTKPKGPEALSLDFTFPAKAHLFGLPEHASPLNLRDTRGAKEGDFTDPYRLMNTDVFEYDYDSPMSLYGSVPVVHAQNKDEAVSAFFLSGAETWIDVDRHAQSARTHWMAESGILDLLVMLSPTPAGNIQKFTELVGRSTAPPTFALGYHQCRWNYNSDSDVLNVQARFDEADIPMDVMWLDIEYSKEHMYGIWDELNFPNPEKMVGDLNERGRKLVIILDPHFKRSKEYWLYSEAQDQKVLVKLPGGEDRQGDGEYEGWCWSGSASWVDMFNPKATTWWASQFRLGGSLSSTPIKANARNVHVWNDMNEPAIFNGPEITSPKDVIHHGGWEHRDIHNINGVLFQAGTFKGLQEREGKKEHEKRRPFVLSRSWWVGTQKYGAIWTGDNLGTWEHLAVSVPMILSNNVAGMSFCGADIGGFFGNPSPEMLVRWYQAGIFEPFFRAHAHIDTKRREPYLLDEPYRGHVRGLIRTRYSMLPVWTTAFREAADEGSGLPVLRPQFLAFPHDEEGLDIDDQYYLGDSGLLVKPAVKEGATSVDVYLADEEPYYHYWTQQVYRRGAGAKASRRVDVPAPLDETAPLLQRGGSILPIRERVRRAAELGWKDPVTLVVALDGEGKSATGVLYLDDGQTYHYKTGAYVWRRFDLERTKEGEYELRSRDEAALRQEAAGSSSAVSTTKGNTDASHVPPYDASNEFATAIKDVRVEKVVILGLPGDEQVSFSIEASGDISGGSKSAGAISSTFTPGVAAQPAKKKTKGGAEGTASRLVIKDPKVLVRGDWTIKIARK
ncbi:alpha-glucosidase II precursor [Jaminaea rosea]|uniref:Glucosidase II subunit alpha n=1 Tax=Jaminaea rosea TaxID=1569628 RepID=A0A316UUM5_9BASI|nr:alpha-glucosidase II precursor [Jaminaea rosea]PWN26815.1 alpha-glucosidase II precursor [Jaminaea rosea]